MENEQVYKMMDEVMKYVPEVLQNESKLKKHLIFMKYFSSFEWFNIATVLYQNPTAKNVKTTSAWIKAFDRELFPKKGQRGIQIFIPLYKGNVLQWKIVKVFDVAQMQITIKPKFASPLQEAINEIGADKMDRLLKGAWKEEIIENTIAMKRFKNYTKEEKAFAKDCCIYSLADTLVFDMDDIDNLSLSVPSTANSVNLYKFIKDVITLVPNVLKDYIFEEALKEQEKLEVDKALRISQANIKTNIKYAKQICDDRLQKQTDSDGLEEDMDEKEILNIGIPDEVIQDNEIYREEV